MNENIQLYPNIENVFVDKSLGIFFKPLLTIKTLINDEDYSIHIISTDGLFCKNQYKYSENNFFGFKYINGKYEFLGELDVFDDYEKIHKLHNALEKDFTQNRDTYLKEKRTVDDYLENILLQLEKNNVYDFSNAEYYAEAFYSYNFTKYFYEKFGVHKHISVITENYGKNTDPFLLDKKEALSILEEFLINMNYNLKSDYQINQNMLMAATEISRFMTIARDGIVFSLLDTTNKIVYILEY
ncbi:hypothetical protein [Flavobacterium anhuiense]|uniref:hypothetical protein n=1 Tax=Flavobacterium anhuiense TaxID=459526 RepID=UPI00101C0930|nr:hypothetical protein [Flavobacterium anhuiense]